MKRLRHGYGYLLISFLMLGVCGSVYALPQDWGCVPLKANAIRALQDDVGEESIRFVGDDGDVQLEISFWADETGRADLDCGNQGCIGVLKNTTAGIREEMNFYCEFAEHDVVSCVPVNWRMLVLDLVEEGKYELAMCGGEIVYHLDMRECTSCECALERHENSGKVTKALMTCVAYQHDEAKVVCLDGYGMEMYAKKLGGFERCLQ